MNNALGFLVAIAKYKIGDLVRYRYYDKELEDYVSLETVIVMVRYCSDKFLGPYVDYIIRDWDSEVSENELEEI